MDTHLICCAFYLTVALVYAYALWFDAFVVKIGDSNIWTYTGYGGKFKYLTFWNHCLQTAYFMLCAVSCVLGEGDKSAAITKNGPRSDHGGFSLQRLRDIIHTSLVFPVGTFVVLTFWGLYYLDRELVFPHALDDIIPSWLNHVMHTSILPILLLEKWLVHHSHPARHRGIIIGNAFAICYISWMLWIAYAADIWVYPVLGVLGMGGRGVFIVSLCVFSNLLYLLGEGITRFLWRKETKGATALPEALEKRRRKRKRK